MTHNEIENASDIEALRAECIRLRQGLWECYKISGADTDGDETPAALVSDIVYVVIDAVQDLRKCYDEACEQLEIDP